MRIFILCLLLLTFAGITPQSASAQDITEAAIARVTAGMTPDALYNKLKMTGENIVDAYKGKTFGEATNACLNTPPAGMGVTPDQWKRKYSGRFSFCMRELLIGATNGIVGAVTDYMRPAMAAMILFATTFMGLKAIAGMLRDPRAEAAMFLGKIFLVVALYENLDIIADTVFGIADLIFRLVGTAGAATFGASNTGMTAGCNVTATTGTLSEWLIVFDHLDCLIEGLVGTGSDLQLITGLGAILAASIWTGTTGIQLFFMTVSLLIGLLTFLMRVTFMLVMAYGAIGLTLIMAPVMVLGIFFRITEPYFFNRIIGYIVSNLVQGGVMIAFLFFAVTVLDRIIYTGNPGANYSYTAGSVTHYEPTLMPIWMPLGINPNATIGVQVEQMAANFGPEEKLFEFEVPTDPNFYKNLTKRCGKMGISETADDLIAKARSSADWVKDNVGDQFTDVDEALGALDQLSTWNLIKANMKLCAAGLAGRVGWTGQLNKLVNKQLDDYIPMVQKLELKNNVPRDPNMQQNMESVHEYNMGKLKVAIVALVVLLGTFFTYTNNIPTIARAITGRMGTGLTLPDPQVAGQGMLNRIQNSLRGAEDKWVDDVKKPHAPLKDRVGTGAAKTLAGSRNK